MATMAIALCPGKLFCMVSCTNMRPCLFLFQTVEKSEIKKIYPRRKKQIVMYCRACCSAVHVLYSHLDSFHQTHTKHIAIIANWLILFTRPWDTTGFLRTRKTVTKVCALTSNTTALTLTHHRVWSILCIR